MQMMEFKGNDGRRISIKMDCVSSFSEGLKNKETTEVFLLGEEYPFVICITYEEFKALYIESMGNEANVDNSWKDHYHSTGSGPTGPVLQGDYLNG